jgi:hypothetical protein
VCQKRIAKHVQQYELGAEILGELGCPIHDLAPDRSIIHRSDNTTRSFLSAITYDQGWYSEAPDEALEGAAPVSVQRLAPEYHEIHIEFAGHVSQTLDGMSGPHVHWKVLGAERRRETTQAGEWVTDRCLEPVVKHRRHYLQKSRYLRNRKYVCEFNPRAAPKVGGGPPGGCEWGLAEVHTYQYALEYWLGYPRFSGPRDAIGLDHVFSSSSQLHRTHVFVSGMTERRSNAIGDWQMRQVP